MENKILCFILLKGRHCVCLSLSLSLFLFLSKDTNLLSTANRQIHCGGSFGEGCLPVEYVTSLQLIQNSEKNNLKQIRKPAFKILFLLLLLFVFLFL